MNINDVLGSPNQYQEKPVFRKDDFFEIANMKKFAEELLNCSPYDRDKMQLFFEQMTKGIKLHISVLSNLDRQKKLRYFHVSVRSDNGSRGYKLPDIEGISKLIDIYIEGKHKVELNLTELYNEAIAV